MFNLFLHESLSMGYVLIREAYCRMTADAIIAVALGVFAEINPRITAHVALMYLEDPEARSTRLRRPVYTELGGDVPREIPFNA